MAGRLDKSVHKMGVYYPQLVFRLEQGQSEAVGAWSGVVQPIKSQDHWEDILDDLAHERTVRIVAGEVRHHPSCEEEHCRHEWMGKIGDLHIPFEIEVRYDGGPNHPRCWVLSPPIPQDKKMHVWLGDGSICPFYASEEVWDYRENDLVDFMDHVPIWLAKWIVWDQTGEWIGRQHGSGPQYHLATIKPSQQCWCRSGRKYVKCHMDEDLRAVGLPGVKWRRRRRV